MSFLKHFLVLVLFVCFAGAGLAQTKPAFWDDVQAIKAYDKMYQVPAQPIVFVGSSSIRKWDGLQVTFGGYNVLNRGIGGTFINDIIFYLDDMVLRYQPRQIVIYVGENDITSADETADTILNRTERLFKAIRTKMPEVPIIYIGFKPSPSREKYVQKTIATNQLLRKFITSQSKATFVDVFPLMMKNGKMMPELFVGDKLHMNAKGYAIWEKAVMPYLLKPAL
ncbi:GDSL family lipase [Mucilaginibacter sp. HMF5004]|uniref:GDSL-type esterase/lipase family protein n=1 Tax=Mucilaginibacter rivuli TaxID=2857527 RepID=UPI001C6031BE|nr:GDSL-type esterase/lipase family protein [Mucilaginibacter rivuli]MBW4888550.1 GDSL family lipase [Mucilaginibacter rivuli]